jgi:hypothetical protein
MDFFNNDYFNPNSHFRFYDDGSSIDEVGEYEVDVSFTYAPIYESLEEDMRGPSDRPTPPPAPVNTPPMAPPPSFNPSKNDPKAKVLAGSQYSEGPQAFGGPQGPGGNTKAVSPVSIRPCLFKYTYIWQNNGRSYWAYLTSVDRYSVSGWRWMFYRWVYFGIDIRRIDTFICY